MARSGIWFAITLLLCSIASSQSKANYRVIAPEIVVQGEDFTIRITQDSQTGQVPIPAGSHITVNGTAILSEDQGKVRVPAFLDQIGNQFLVITIGETGTTDSPHVEVLHLLQPRGQLSSTIWRTSETTSGNGDLRVDGQGLNTLRSAGLQGSAGNYSLNDSVGSSLQRVYRCPADLPKGHYRFVAQDSSGQKVEAPNTTTNPTLTITGDKIRKRGQRGRFVVTSDVEGDVTLSGGEPIIHLDTKTVHVIPNQTAKIDFTANQVGNYDVRVEMTTPDWPPASAPRADVNVGMLQSHLNSSENTTTVSAQITVTDNRGQPLPNVPVDMALTAPDGIKCSRVVTDKNGRANFQDQERGQVPSDALKLHCFRVRGYLWNKQPPPAPPQQQKRRQNRKYEYAVKFVCGSPVAPVVAPGRYFTAINVHNPGGLPVLFEKKEAVALPGERAGTVSPFYQAHLGPDEALEIDCPDILQHAHQGGFLKGFVVIESPMELDVVAVYSAGHPEVETLDMDRVRPRLIVPAEIVAPTAEK